MNDYNKRVIEEYVDGLIEEKNGCVDGLRLQVFSYADVKSPFFYGWLADNNEIVTTRRSCVDLEEWNIDEGVLREYAHNYYQGLVTV